MVRRSLEAFAESQLHVLLFLAFLPYSSLLMLDAISRTMRRVFFTRTRLLEWQTAAETEMGALRRGPVEKYLDASAWIGLIVGAALAWKDPASLLIAGPLLLLWIFVKPMTRWLDHPPQRARVSSIEGDETFLRDAALLQWRFFAERAHAEDNWLVPDSVQEAPAIVVRRTSPTNMGFNSTPNWRRSSWATSLCPNRWSESRRRMGAIERLERPHGHLLNWYDTDTLRAIPPFFVSTVDNGNLIGCLWALEQGLLEFLDRPAISAALAKGLGDHLRALFATLDPPDGAPSEDYWRLQTVAETWWKPRSRAAIPSRRCCSLPTVSQRIRPRTRKPAEPGGRPSRIAFVLCARRWRPLRHGSIRRRAAA